MILVGPVMELMKSRSDLVRSGEVKESTESLLGRFRRSTFRAPSWSDLKVIPRGPCSMPFLSWKPCVFANLFFLMHLLTKKARSRRRMRRPTEAPTIAPMLRGFFLSSSTLIAELVSSGLVVTKLSKHMPKPSTTALPFIQPAAAHEPSLREDWSLQERH